MTSINALAGNPNVKTALLKSSSTITEENVIKAGVLVGKTAGKKWTEQDHYTLLVSGTVCLLVLLLDAPVILMGTVFNKSD